MNFMKLQTLAAILFLGAGLEARGALYGPYTDLPSSGYIPDGTSAGWWDTRNVGTVTIPVGWTAEVTVTFTISGGYNGDLYGYLSHGGVLVPLLNQAGTGLGGEPQYSFGFTTAGFNNITLANSATANGSIHNVENPVSGQSYLPDGGSLSSFANVNPSGSWTLFFSDLSSDAGPHSQVTSWSMDITAVPEPANVALGLFGSLSLVAVAARRREQLRERFSRLRTAFVQWLDAV